jgi:hypothetical protein
MESARRVEFAPLGIGIIDHGAWNGRGNEGFLGEIGVFTPSHSIFIKPPQVAGRIVPSFSQS